MRKLFILTFLILGIVSSFANEWKQIIKNQGSAVCLIEISDSKMLRESGSGFLISNDGTVLTNAHVVKSAKYNKDLKIELSFKLAEDPDKKYEAEIVRFSKELDLAVLKINGTFDKICTFADADSLQIMDDILVMGYPLGKNIKATTGVLQAFQDIDNFGKMLDISVDVDPGNSGGPVFNDKGEVIGIVTAEFWGYNFNLAIPVKLITQYISLSDQDTKLKITTNPSEARIYVNGKYTGTSPVEIDFYGTAIEIKAEKKSFIKQTTIIEVMPENSTVEIKMEEEESKICILTINSTPSGAVVLIDNKEIGKTPVEVEVDQNTKIRIRIIKRWYKEFNEVIFTEYNTELNFNFNLKK